MLPICDVRFECENDEDVFLSEYMKRGFGQMAICMERSISPDDFAFYACTCFAKGLRVTLNPFTQPSQLAYEVFSDRFKTI